MTRYFRAGDSIRAAKIFYCFGKAPDSAVKRKGRYRGSFTRNGYARTVVPLIRAASPSPSEPDEIHCKSAWFECSERPRLPGKKEPCGNHTCFTGYVRGDALARIKVPLRHHA